MSDLSQVPTTEELSALADMASPRPPAVKLTPLEWIKRNLFNSGVNTAITLILGPITLYLLYRLVRYIFVTGEWAPVRANLELFMIGTFPREERWRVVAQLLTMSFAVGAATGLIRASSREQVEESGVEVPPSTWRTYANSYWSIAFFVFVSLAAFVRTLGPILIALGIIALFIVAMLITSRLDANVRPYGWAITGVIGAASFKILSGTGGYAWFFTTIALWPAVSALATKIPTSALIGVAGLGTALSLINMIMRPGVFSLIFLAIGIYGAFLAWQGDRVDGSRYGLVVILGFVNYYLMNAIGLSGIDWSKWSGLHINLVVAAAAIVLAFPLGLLLALGRRSTLPALRFMSVAYIELFRGAPLITFLLAGQFFLGFFLNTSEIPSDITRAIAAITLFSAAYIAEIVRGGLQAVPKGQTEAGQALGMSAPAITRLLVLPQALRAVIPAMVGQFISLFKDTSLLYIIAITEFLGVRGLIHGQAEFRSLGLAETLAYIAFGFWAFAFAMSRESQRLERRLAVGQR